MKDSERKVDTILNMDLIGVAGLPRSGKDSLAEILIENGYYGVSLGDIVRDESRKRHADEPDPISVKNMTETSNYLRTEKGADFALREALERFNHASQNYNYKGLVVFSVRAPVEADYILKNGGKLIWVEASDETRYLRSIKHRREGEAEQSLDEMLTDEKLQEVPQPNLPSEVQMNTSYVKSKANILIENNQDDMDLFKAKVKKEMKMDE